MRSIQFLRTLILLVAILPISGYSQNPLKKEIKGSTTSVYYSPSQFSFTSYPTGSVFVKDLTDNRSDYWNKVVNDSIKIDLIRDFWNYNYKMLFKNKIHQDFSKSNIKVEPMNPTADMIQIEPSVDIHFPSLVNYPNKGYWVLTKVNMKVFKGANTLFTKSYQDYSFWGKNDADFKDEYLTNFNEGTNKAMWTSMKKTLDQFYVDLNETFGGKTVASNDTKVKVSSKISNIKSDDNLTKKQSAYSEAKDKGTTVNPEANYKMEDKKVETPVVADPNLENAMNALKGKKEETKKVVTEAKKIEGKPIAPIMDSAKQAEKALRTEMRKKAIDSARKIREEMAAKSKVKTETPSTDKSKRDSILAANKANLAEKMKARALSDSTKKAEVSKKIEEAKAKRELEKKKIADNKPKVEEKKTVIEKPKETNTEVYHNPNPRKTSYKNGNVDMAEEIKRIAREVEMEENNNGNKYKVEAPKKIEKPKVETPKTETPKTEAKQSAAARKAERDSLTAISNKEKELVKNTRKARLDSLIAARKLKTENLEAKVKKIDSSKMIQAEKKVKVEKPLEIKPVDPKKYEQDSIKLALEKLRKKEAIIAAQKAAMEAERKALEKNPNAGEMFATVSTDPPSKLPDTRSREQVLAGRIFTPKNDTAKHLLSRVKLITPEEEARLLAMLNNGGDMGSVDSFFIHQQLNRPIPTHTPADSTKHVAPKELNKVKGDSKKIDAKKTAIKDTVKAKSDKVVMTKKDSLINKSIEAVKAKADTPKVKTDGPKVMTKRDSLVLQMKAKIAAAKAKKDSTTTTPTPVQETPKSTPPAALTPAPEKKQTTKEVVKEVSKAEKTAEELDADAAKKAAELKAKLKKVVLE